MHACSVCGTCTIMCTFMQERESKIRVLPTLYVYLLVMYSTSKWLDCKRTAEDISTHTHTHTNTLWKNSFDFQVHSQAASPFKVQVSVVCAQLLRGVSMWQMTKYDSILMDYLENLDKYADVHNIL